MVSPGPYCHAYRLADGSRFHGNLRLFETDGRFAAFLADSHLPLIAQRIFGPRNERVNLFYDQLFVKESKSDAVTRWHNDLPYWPIEGNKVLSIWIAVDYTTLASGGLEFVAKSHLDGIFYQPVLFGEASGAEQYSINPDYRPIPDIDANRDKYEFLSWDLEPGDALVFHGLTVHGARGNQENRRRRGYTVRFCGDDVVSAGDKLGTHKALRNPDLNAGDPLGDSPQHPLVYPPNVGKYLRRERKA